MALNNKGQAAITDALYFLVIVSSLSTFLFFFAANYGLTLQERVVTEYWQEYATSALETILYSSTPRISGYTLENAPEVDYILAAVKEDYADDSKINETSEVLAQNISGIMQPIAGNFDYLFYIYLPDTKKFAFVMLYTKEAPTITETAIQPGKAAILFCDPPTLNDLERLIENVGTSAQSNARIQLVAEDEKSYPIAQANLALWVPTPINDIITSLNCTVYKTINPD